MIYHPTIIILAAVLALIIFYKQKKLFNFISLLAPIIALYLFYGLPESNNIKLFNIILTYEVTDYNKLIGTAFMLVLFAANLYAIGQKKKTEIIFGNSYGAFSFLCLLAGDFLSMFIGLELTMITSSCIIFIGGMHASLRSAKKYFLTHLMSSNMIIIGIAYLVNKNNSLTIVPITELIHSPEYSTIILSIMLIGMLINIAVFPFSGWMVNYYPKASPTGFLYLISFTTKISVVLLIKLFAGYQPLEYVAIIMIIYASIKSLFEDNLLSLLCYLSIMSMGLMLLGISNGSDTVILATISYLFVHIIYKSLLSISITSLIDKTGVDSCSDLKKINCKPILAGLIIGVTAMIGIPIISLFYIKSAIAQEFMGTMTYFVITFVSFMTVLVLPWKQYFTATESFNIKTKIHATFSILLMCTVLVVISIFAKYVPILSDIKTVQEASLFHIHSLKQVIIILSALFIAMLWKIKRKITKPINFTEYIGNIIFYAYAIWLEKQPNKEDNREPFAIESLEKQITLWFTKLHNQQTAIFIIFLMFIVMLIALTINV